MDARHFGVAEANRYVPLLQRTFTLVRAELQRIQEIDAQLGRSAAPARTGWRRSAPPASAGCRASCRRSPTWASR
ncbi:MAG TPA: hypothetical protein VFB81_20145 [Myxococcales bacterium]|nr:hypothetical protein [Myxococcales bacterium]